MNFVWYSNASDETGKTLAAELGFESGKKTPDFSKISTLVCWGAKGGTKYDPANLDNRIASGDLRVLNHPGTIDKNKNKLRMLKLMGDRGVPIPAYVNVGGLNKAEMRHAITASLDSGRMDFPLLLMNRFNKGRPSFVYTNHELQRCLDTIHAKSSKVEIDMVRCYAHGEDYRLHVFRDSVIWAQKSQVSKDPKTAVADGLRTKLMKQAKKLGRGMSVSSDDLEFIVQELADDLLCGPHQFQRTVGHGMELVDTNTDRLPEELVVAAIQALDAVELDMGAVNLSYDNGTVQVTNVISYPGLDVKQMKAYAKAIQAFSKEKEPREKEIPTETSEKKAGSALVAKLTRRIKRMSTTQATKMLKDLGE